MPPFGRRWRAILDLQSLFDCARGHSCRFDLICNFVGFFGFEIHRYFYAVSFDKDAHHAKIGWSDLNVRFDVAFAVDTHGGPLDLLVNSLPWCGLDWQGQGGQTWGMTFTIRPFDAADADWLVTEHAEHYSRVEGFDDTFGPLVDSIIRSFIDDHNPMCEAGWIAQDQDQRLGSIFCVRRNATTAKLRLFYVVDKARGTGAAQALLDQCLGFARGAGYAGLTLWTHESHKAAGAIYTRNGLTRTDAKPVHSFGVDLIEETWEIAF